jgi:2-polyprenyl-6-methoxyphenol hydroxylase-like FAD-dependent oxidoreductase
VRHKVIYRVHQRVASEWRVGRVLLAGDAAHLNNPLGAFGLNSGIHDAVNLAEKLGRVWRGESGAELLDLYVRQRRAACVEQVQAMSIRNKRLLEERDPSVQRARMEELVATANDPEQARAFLLESSMISGLRKSEAIDEDLPLRRASASAWCRDGACSTHHGPRGAGQVRLSPARNRPLHRQPDRLGENELLAKSATRFTLSTR